MTTEKPAETYSTEPEVNKGGLPDPFELSGGGRVSTKNEWADRSDEWRNMIIDVEYGGLPPAPESIKAETLCHSVIRRFPGKPLNWSYRIHCHGGKRPFSFCVRILFPPSSKPVPAIINGDGCWWDIFSDEPVRAVTEGGFALVIFNRTEMAEDLGYQDVPDKHKRAGGLYDVYPGHGFGALAAWAWGYHRCIDLMEGLPFIDKSRIAVTGHSRGGKTALLAGASDKRISVVNDNASGAGGGGVPLCRGRRRKP